MNLLFIGDVVGESGCEFLEKHIYSIKRNITLISHNNKR